MRGFRVVEIAAATTVVAALFSACGGGDESSPKSKVFGGAGGQGASSGGPAGGAGGTTAGAAGLDGSAGSSGGGGTSGAAAGGTSGAAGAGPDGSSGTGPGGASGAGPGGASGAGPGGAAGASGAAGTTGQMCGNGTREGTEECDGIDGLSSCQSLGFTSGSTVCSNCAIDTSGCTGVEDCFDDKDNDGDALTDCNDPDCIAACSQSCGVGSTMLADPAIVSSDTSGHAATLSTGCAPPLHGDAGISGTGPEIVYELTAANTGVLDARLTSPVNLSLSVRTNCTELGTELGCSENVFFSPTPPFPLERVLVPVTANDKLFVIVDGSGSGVAGSFTLDVSTRPIDCVDGFRDPGEECDDGNMFDVDGCTNACTLNSDEVESNDTSGTATPYSGFPFFAAIGVKDDVDFYSIQVSSPSSLLEVELLDLGNGECGQGLADSFIQIIDTDGSTIITSDNDGGDGLCSRALAASVNPGTYFVRVSAGPSTPTFPYTLGVFVTP